MKIKIIVVLLIWLNFCSVLQASDLAEEITRCNDCHGPDGVSQHSDIPTIAGQSAYFLEEAMLAYAAEDRACQASDFRHGDSSREPVTMCEEAARLEEDAIIALSNHYSELPFARAAQEFDPAKAEVGAKIHDRWCERCHSEGGSYRDDDAGILAGQWTDFLRNTTDEYRTGTRPMSDKMAAAFEALNDDEFEALLHFYASPSAGN